MLSFSSPCDAASEMGMPLKGMLMGVQVRPGEYWSSDGRRCGC